MRLHLASDAIVEDTLFANVAAYMWACRYGFALLEDRVDEGMNYNVVIEVGAMVMAGRQTALLKDTTIPALPTDLAGTSTSLWTSSTLTQWPAPHVRGSRTTSASEVDLERTWAASETGRLRIDGGAP